MLLLLIALFVLAAACTVGLAFRHPRAVMVVWIFAMETSPDAWLDNLVGGHETIIGIMKGFGLVLVGVCGLADGWRRDRYNPGFSFAFMFTAGLLHGLYPGLTLLASLRSLIGSAAPFMFSLARLRAGFTRAIIRAVIWGPTLTIGFGAMLAATGLDQMFDIEQGAMRLGASGQPPFLAGFALVGVYAGLMEYLRHARRADAAWVALNLVIILLTGARTPLALGCTITLIYVVTQRRLSLLAALGAVASLALIFASRLTFLRVIDLAQLGEATDLSNRNLVWPLFEQAAATSPWLGWGVGAGKIIIPLTSGIADLIGTNAAHNEYLRIGAEGGVIGLGLLILLMALWLEHNAARLPGPQRWLMRLIFIGFAIHSATDNTLIATTSSIFFLWVSAIFADAREPPTPRA
ncbi:MAG: O-antigen ligase family protein [Acidocella sp.]|nr:O-antigen ligase family protein [Acidocella sp.]